MSNSTLQTAYLASGCFWGTEYWLKKAKGTTSTQVGYTGGHTENPSYDEICTGTTGHAEAVKVVFDPELTSYEAVLKIFFETHDPSQIDRQGPDIGSQYRSAIFYQTEEQKTTALKVIALLEAQGIKVATELKPVQKFWVAENYHQNYYFKKGQIPYCHIYKKKF